MEILISKALIDPYMSHHEFVSVNNVLREYDAMKEAIKSLKQTWILAPEIGQWPMKAPLQRTQLFGVKLRKIISDRHLKNQKYSVSICLSCSGFTSVSPFSGISQKYLQFRLITHEGVFSSHYNLGKNWKYSPKGGK